MERVFVASDLPAKFAAIKVGSVLIIRDRELEPQVRSRLDDAPLQLIRTAELAGPTDA